MDTLEQLKEQIRQDLMKEFGRQGGLARAKALTPKQRRAIARKGARARVAKLRARKASP